MEYSINQPVIYEHLDDKFTGKIVGQAICHYDDFGKVWWRLRVPFEGKGFTAPRMVGFCVLLDKPLHDGTKVQLVPFSLVRPLVCYWCLDTKKVIANPVTKGQIESGDIPKVDCPYCKSVR
jgi:hypothetical protein